MTKPRFYRSAGPKNTRETLELARARAKELGLDHVIVATTSGKTAVSALDVMDEKIKVVAVSHQAGYKVKGQIELEPQYRKEIEKRGRLVVGSDIFSRVPKFITSKYGGSTALNIVADTLRLFSAGVKVCVECSVKAADDGAIPVDQKTIAVAGTVSGADTAIVITPQHMHDFFDIKIHEIIAMPREQ